MGLCPWAVTLTSVSYLWFYFNMVTFSLRNKRRLFLDLHQEKLVGYTFMAPVASAPDKLNVSVIFCFHLYLQISRCGVPFKLNYLMDPKIVIYFLLRSTFLLWTWGVMTSKLFICQSEDQNLITHLPYRALQHLSFIKFHYFF